MIKSSPSNEVQSVLFFSSQSQNKGSIRTKQGLEVFLFMFQSLKPLGSVSNSKVLIVKVSLGKYS